MQRALLRELRREHGQHALADDRRLDHRRRVDADHRRAVRQRVEEVRTRLVGDRRARPPAGHTTAFPNRPDRPRAMAGLVRVRPDEDPDAAAAARRRSPGSPRSTRARTATPARRSSQGSSTCRARTGGPDRARLARERFPRTLLGRRSNHASKSCAPVATTRSAGMPCSSTASRRWASFQTKTRSGMNRSSPLFVRLSQLATQSRAGIPRRRALFRWSTCMEARLTTGVASTTSGACSRMKRSIARLVGIASSSRAATRMTRSESSASVVAASRRASRSATRRPSGSNAWDLTRCLMILPAIRWRKQRRSLVPRMRVARQVGERPDEPGDRAPAVAGGPLRREAAASTPSGSYLLAPLGQVSLRAWKASVHLVAALGQLGDEGRVTAFGRTAVRLRRRGLAGVAWSSSNQR